jgi:formate dehydrogenase accessory protein FdhD
MKEPEMAPGAEAYASGYVAVKARRFDGTAFSDTMEKVIEEVPVSLEWNGTHHIVMMATPTDLEAFGIGFSLTEGIVDSAGEVLSVEAVPAGAGAAILMRIPEDRLVHVASRRRAGVSGSSCGLCGITDMEAALRLRGKVDSTLVFSSSAVVRAMQELPSRQKINLQTGAAHAAAFALPSGEIAAVCEDAGRHNALDKLVGTLHLQGLVPSSGFLLLTSRASLEMVQKAVAAGFPMMCAISAPTALAVRMAERSNLTLAAFVRGDGFVCFSGQRRLSP